LKNCLRLLCATAAVAAATPLSAAEQPAPATPAYSGTIGIAVDLTDTDHRVFRVHESIPVSAGPMTLWYPEWLPGNHGPRGPIDAVAGLVLSAGGQRIEWLRDPLDVYAFKFTVPAGVTQLDVDFQYASPVVKDQGRQVATPEIVGLQWNAVSLYPKGYDARLIQFAPSITLPAGWQVGGALETATRVGDTVTFKPVTFETLVDSPLFAGRNFKRIDLAPGAATPVFLDLVADRPENLEIKPEQLELHRKLVKEAVRLYGSQHYDHYDFLLALSENFSGIGLEHHRSSENGEDPGYFTDWDKSAVSRSLLPHEYTHSWNGKFRRPADLWTPNFNVPMQDSGLWVYEGMTQYWGQVLSARSGLWTPELTRDSLAAIAASLDRGRPGRSWRALLDTTNQPIITARRPLSYTSWQRTEDYYNEGLLIWLDVDTKLRELSRGHRSLDDFAKAFLGIKDGSYAPEVYDFDELVSVLNSVEAYDWHSFLRARLDGHGLDGKAGAPLDGLTRAGWKLVYTDKPSEFTKGSEESRKVKDHSYSLGIVVGKDGELSDVLWDSPAFNAGIAKGMTLVAVNGRAYKPEFLKDAIIAGRNGTPIELLLKNYDQYRTVKIDYRDGLQYPHLQRIDGTPDRLEDILKSRT
jgi:predicted metalloprotease with PDZ domain